MVSLSDLITVSLISRACRLLKALWVCHEMLSNASALRRDRQRVGDGFFSFNRKSGYRDTLFELCCRFD